MTALIGACVVIASGCTRAEPGPAGPTVDVARASDAPATSADVVALLAACDSLSRHSVLSRSERAIRARGARRQCLRDVLDRSFEASSAITLAGVNSHAQRSVPFARDCHMLMHHYGRRFGRRVRDPRRVPLGGKDCAAGFLHGMLEAQLDSPNKISRALVQRYCTSYPIALAQADCEHGVGHVLMRAHGNDIVKALTDCARLGDPVFHTNCAGGTLMEMRFAQDARDDARTLPKQLRGPAGAACAQLPIGYRGWCRGWEVRRIATERRYAWCTRSDSTARRRTTRQCLLGTGASIRDGTQLNELRSICRQSAACWYGGGYAGGAPPNTSSTSIRTLCPTAPTGALRRSCIDGARLRSSARRPAIWFA